MHKNLNQLCPICDVETGVEAIRVAHLVDKHNLVIPVGERLVLMNRVYELMNSSDEEMNELAHTLAYNMTYEEVYAMFCIHGYKHEGSNIPGHETIFAMNLEKSGVEDLLRTYYDGFIIGQASRAILWKQK